MTSLDEKISASLVLGSYLDTLGFANGLWEFNFNTIVRNLKDAMLINYEILTNFFSHGGFNIDITGWNASDDTIMMIATMKACKKGGDQKHFIDEYLKIFPLLQDKKRISGITTLNSLRILSKSKDPAKIIYSDSMGGNGAAMRTHYIGIHFKDINKIIKISIMASRLTHNYPLGFLGGMITAVFTHYAINNIDPWKWCDNILKLEEDGIIDKIVKDLDPSTFDSYMKDKEEFWDAWYKFRERRVRRFDTRAVEFIHSADRFNDLIDILYKNPNDIDYNRLGGSGAAATIIAYDSILLSILSNVPSHSTIHLDEPDTLIYSWQNLVFLSTLHFGDNDTIGAITGMLYGALRGYDGVNKKVVNMLEFKKELI
jgi:ADP-ribosylarginine hydrolase